MNIAYSMHSVKQSSHILETPRICALPHYFAFLSNSTRPIASFSLRLLDFGGAQCTFRALPSIRISKEFPTEIFDFRNHCLDAPASSAFLRQRFRVFYTLLSSNSVTPKNGDNLPLMARLLYSTSLYAYSLPFEGYANATRSLKTTKKPCVKWSIISQRNIITRSSTSTSH